LRFQTKNWRITRSLGRWPDFRRPVYSSDSSLMSSLLRRFRCPCLCSVYALFGSGLSPGSLSLFYGDIHMIYRLSQASFGNCSDLIWGRSVYCCRAWILWRFGLIRNRERWGDLGGTGLLPIWNFDKFLFIFLFQNCLFAFNWRWLISFIFDNDTRL
jgi:hypothetical protein